AWRPVLMSRTGVAVAGVPVSGRLPQPVGQAVDCGVAAVVPAAAGAATVPSAAPAGASVAQLVAHRIVLVRSIFAPRGGLLLISGETAGFTRWLRCCRAKREVPATGGDRWDARDGNHR